MTRSRIDQLRNLIINDSSDPFLYYALALELVKVSDQEASKHFDHLMNAFPNYLPAYYHAGHWYLGLNQIEKAKAILRKGVEKSKTQNDLKTLAEIITLLGE